MTIDPREYDLNELRGQPSPKGEGSLNDRKTVRNGVKHGFDPSSPDEVLQSGQYRDLFFLESVASEDDLVKPYLGTLPESYSGEIMIFEWLEFLFDKTGYRGALEAIRYYRSINWITSDVEEELGEYLVGMNPGSGSESGSLSRPDHVLSLMYIGRLAAIMDS